MTLEATKLLEFWKECPTTHPPYVHPKDEVILRERGHWPDHNDPVDFEQFLYSNRFGAANDYSFHFSLMPVPYVGDVLRAEIVILLLNPGFHLSEYWAETNIPGLRDRLKRTLLQDFNNDEVPFFPLDPRFCCYGGFRWWEKKLSSVLQAISRHRKITYRAAMHNLAHRIACIELVPYHSASFGDQKLIKEMESAKLARNFAQSLIPAAVSGKRTLIVTRQLAGWGMSMENKSSNIILYTGGHTRGASLSEDSEGGKAILSRYGPAGSRSSG